MGTALDESCGPRAPSAEALINEVQHFEWRHSTPAIVFLTCPSSLIAFSSQYCRKTHSMTGDLAENSEQNGIAPNAVDHIFASIYAQQQEAAESIDDGDDAAAASDDPVAALGLHFLVSLSFLEVYNEHVHGERQMERQ